VKELLRNAAAALCELTNPAARTRLEKLDARGWVPL